MRIMSTSTKYFGTDGIRGEANGKVLRPDIVMRIAQATGQVVKEKGCHERPVAVIGKDTRLSGYMIESAMQAGFTIVGFTTLLLGPVPTPAVAMLTRSLRADVGVMITASHNPYGDNGIKLFTPDGIKMNGGFVEQIEHLVDHPEELIHVPSAEMGRAKRLEDVAGRYMEFIKTTVPRSFSLHGLKVVVDCANGAAYQIAPRIMWELGADVVTMGIVPNGFNINDELGAVAPERLAKAVMQHNADIGIALDGDADRLILVDETGTILDGDFILAALAKHMLHNGRLQGGGVVATVMSNMGLQRYVESLGLQMVRTPVGDHHVESAMREGGFNVGGESSGHLIVRDYATTGDGTLAALQVLAYLRETGQKASSLRELYTPWPLVLKNVRLPEGTVAADVLADDRVKSAVGRVEDGLGKSGRVLIRKSGTEPMIRVMVEAEDDAAVKTGLADIVEAVESVVGVADDKAAE